MIAATIAKPWSFFSATILKRGFRIRSKGMFTMLYFEMEFSLGKTILWNDASRHFILPPHQIFDCEAQADAVLVNRLIVVLR
jgi:hypothetical protein